MARIRISYDPVDFNDLIYEFKDSSISPVSFIKFKGPLHIFKSIHAGNVPLEDVEKKQIVLKGYLAGLNQGNPKNKAQQQK